MTPKNWFSFISLSLVWGSSFLWIKIAIGELGPFTLVAVRLVFGLLVLALAALGVFSTGFIASAVWIVNRTPRATVQAERTMP